MLRSTDEHAAEAFEVVWQAFSDADLPRLEELALSLGESFPCGMDGWLGRRWLTTAIGTGNPAAVTWVLSKGPEVDYVDDGGFTALKSALQVEIDCQIPDRDGRSLTATEAATLTIRLIELLLDAGSDINRRMGLNSTVLHVAAEWSSPAVLHYLLYRGADPFVVTTDYWPETPADAAERRKRWKVHAVLRTAMGTAPGGPRT